MRGQRMVVKLGLLIGLGLMVSAWARAGPDRISRGPDDARAGLPRLAGDDAQSGGGAGQGHRRRR